VDEGIVEGRKDAGNAKDELALADLGSKLQNVSENSNALYPVMLTWMFSCAPRSTFFLGGMLTVELLLDWRFVKVSVELLVGSAKLAFALCGETRSPRLACQARASNFSQVRLRKPRSFFPIAPTWAELLHDIRAETRATCTPWRMARASA
jgi:hypothetical protein